MTTETKALKPIEEVRSVMEKMGSQFKMALPPHITPEKFIRVAMTAVQNNPKLLESNRQSLYGACMKSAQDGLLPDGKESALVQYGDSVAYLPMIAGILKKVRNSGELSSISAQIVYKNEVDSGRFKYWIDGEGEHLNHEPLMFSDRGEKIGVYALAKTKDGAVYIEVMTKDQVMAIKNVSRSKGGPWSGAFEDEMWKKSAIRRLAKRLPMSTDLESTIQRDDDLYELDKPAQSQSPVNQQQEDKPVQKQSRLSKIVEAQEAELAKPSEVKEPNEDPNVDELPL